MRFPDAQRVKPRLTARVRHLAGAKYLRHAQCEGSLSDHLRETAMRRLVVVTILFLISTPAFALGCNLESDCNTGTTCVDGICVRALGSGDDQDQNAPKKSETAKGCFDNSDCSHGICVKGSGLKGACIGQ